MTDPAELAERLLASRRSPAGVRADPRPAAPARFGDHPGIAELQGQFDLADSLDLDRGSFFAPQRKTGNGTVQASGQDGMLNFSSFDYLGLGEHPAVRMAAKEAIDRYGTCVSAARIVGGEIDLFQDLEAEIAEFLDEPAALTFVSGYLTNVSFLGYMLQPRDLVIHDALSHNSMLTGARLSGATRLSFDHNDEDHLESLLRKHRAGAATCVVLVEGIYSMDGDVVNLPAIIDIARAFESEIYIDEAHSFGVLGRTGRGVKEYFDLESSPDTFIMSSLSKAMAGLGGFVAGSAQVLEAVRYQAPGASLYCTAMSPASAAACLAALKLIRDDAGPVTRLWQAARSFSGTLKAQGLDIGLSQATPVVSVITGSSVAAIRLSNALRENGIIAHAILYPAVPEHLARIRLFVTAGHDESDLNWAATTIAACANEVGIATAGRDGR